MSNSHLVVHKKNPLRMTTRRGIQVKTNRSTTQLRTLYYRPAGWVVPRFFWSSSLPAYAGRLLGVYVVFFFIAAQLISLFLFQTRPSVATLIGGAFIIVGGLIICIGNYE